MKCPKCKLGELKKIVKIIVEVPSYQSSLTKSDVKAKDVQILGVDWDIKSIYCANCGYTIGADNETQKDQD